MSRVSKLVGVLAAAAATSVGAAFAADIYTVPLQSKPPVIDGKIEPSEWAVAAGFDGLFTGERIEQRRVQAYIAADEKTIYVAMRSMLPTKGRLMTNVTTDNLNAVYDDSAEVYINPVPDAKDQVQYQHLFNSAGHGGYKIHTVGNGSDNAGWKGNWKVAHSVRNGWWEWECAIPIDSMSKYVKNGRKTTDGVWQINVCRNWKPDWGWSALPAGGGYALAGCNFRFSAKAPAVQFAWDSDPFIQGAKGTLSVLNPTKEPMSLDALLYMTRNNMPELRDGKALTLAPGAKEELAIVLPKDDPTTLFSLTATVKSAAGESFYDRAVKWPKGQQIVWVGDGAKVQKPPLDLKLAYYPSKNRMRLVADVSNMPKTAKLTGMTAVVREAASKKVIHRAVFPVSGFKSGRQEIAFDLPPLKGKYEIALKAEGKGIPTKELVKSFERTVYPWENSTLGMSTKVYAPFTPIEIDGNKLRTVLREYTLNDVGLWDQMVAESSETKIAKPVLAEPMRYTVRIDGQDVPVKAQPIKVLGAKPHIARTRAVFSAGALKATSLGTWDYDGTLKVDLTLLPTGGQKIDELTLEIPFTKEAAELIHANADSIRNPVAQRIPDSPVGDETPDGEGIVWDATQVEYTDYTPNFCPYVFVGSGVRGLAWFAENNQGWGWNPKTPNMFLVRHGDTTVLYVHLINQPTVITKPRTITFGLLGAPVKPRISPTGDPNWWRYRYARDNWSLLGTDINWFALGNCASVYPAGKEMALWEALAKGNTEHVSDEFIKQTVDQGVKYYEPYPDYKQTFIAHVGYNLRARYGTKMVYYYNRASYQDADEFETFKDEWTCDDLRMVDKGNGIWEIKIVPTKSYIDHALYWYIKSFEHGRNQGVYWDNMFFVSTFNTEMTDAYKAADGKVVPATGVWELRDLVKRTFVMMNERGMVPITFPHMTSFNCLPIMSFATVQYDWEWKYSNGEVQDRFNREYIRLCSSGEQAGVWPVLLGDHGPQATDPWIQRTFMASRIVHELDGPQPEAVTRMLDKPGLVVYRYWDDRPQPVSTGDPDVPTVVYSVPGDETVAVVVSYSAKDEAISLGVDTNALGFYNGCAAVDAETGEKLDVQGGRMSFPLKKHDMKIIRFTKAQ
jgi:hypothetical protein